jgi:hypothetical protein
MTLIAIPAAAQEHEAAEQSTEEMAEDAAHEERGEEGEHHEHADHPNEIGFFAGVTDEKGHDAEFSIGFEYERRLSQRWGIGGLSEYTDGLRNSILGVPVYWHPGGGWIFIGAPGVEYHEGRGIIVNPHKSEGGVEVDEDETYFLFRLGVVYQFHLGGA